MPSPEDQLDARVRSLLSRRVRTRPGLAAELGVIQPELASVFHRLAPELIPKVGGDADQYALRDASRKGLQAPVYRVSAAGLLEEIGALIPVLPEGFVLMKSDGTSLHSEGLPWWLFDMRPQGYLGRAYNQAQGARLGTPSNLADWDDRHILQSLLRSGHDLPGDLILGEAAKQAFIKAPSPSPISAADKTLAYAALAAAAARGEQLACAAGGEQPKFTAYAHRESGAAEHVIVKFSLLPDSPTCERWRDLLLAEHLALEVLRSHGIPAANSSVIDHGPQRFLEVCRFDRQGLRGRRGLFSVQALDAEFAGAAGNWPSLVRALAHEGVVEHQAAALTEVLWAFGTLIGNTDMHGGNLSFLADQGRPYQLAPAYDMTCMAFAPTPAGVLPARRLHLNISSEAPVSAWQRALPMAQDFVGRLRGQPCLSEGFAGCMAVLSEHIDAASKCISQLPPT